MHREQISNLDNCYDLQLDGVLLRIKVIAGSPKDQILGESAGLLRIKIAAPPVEGRANRELCKYLAQIFRISKSDVEILKGFHSSSKVVKLYSVDPVLFRENLFVSVER